MAKVATERMANSIAAEDGRFDVISVCPLFADVAIAGVIHSLAHVRQRAVGVANATVAAVAVTLDHVAHGRGLEARSPKELRAGLGQNFRTDGEQEALLLLHPRLHHGIGMNDWSLIRRGWTGCYTTSIVPNLVPYCAQKCALVAYRC